MYTHTYIINKLHTTLIHTLHTHIHTYMHTCITYTTNTTHIHTYIYIHTHIHTYITSLQHTHMQTSLPSIPRKGNARDNREQTVSKGTLLRQRAHKRVISKTKIKLKRPSSVLCSPREKSCAKHESNIRHNTDHNYRYKFLFVYFYTLGNYMSNSTTRGEIRT